MLPDFDSSYAMQTRVRPSEVLVTAIFVDPVLYEILDSLFSYGLSCGSSNIPYPLCFSDAVADRSVYSEDSSGSSGLCISLGLG
jgi:hypothetical protein